MIPLTGDALSGIPEMRPGEYAVFQSYCTEPGKSYSSSLKKARRIKIWVIRALYGSLYGRYRCLFFINDQFSEGYLGRHLSASAGRLSPRTKTHPHPDPLPEGEGLMDKDNSIGEFPKCTEDD